MVENIFTSGGQRQFSAPRPGLIGGVILVILVVVIVFSSSYVIETGNVGVIKTLGTVNLEEVSPGFHLRP